MYNVTSYNSMTPMYFIAGRLYDIFLGEILFNFHSIEITVKLPQWLVVIGEGGNNSKDGFRAVHLVPSSWYDNLGLIFLLISKCVYSAAP